MTKAEKAVPRQRRYAINAEALNEDRVKQAIAAFKLKRRIQYKKDEMFRGFYTITLTSTLDEANKLRDAIWEQNGGAFCELKAIR